MYTRNMAIWAVAACLFMGPLARARANEADAGSDKKAALEWLNDFAKRQVLFHADDVKKLQTRVAAMSEEEAAKWWEEKAPEREALSSPEWLETEKWLREFLRVQAIYSDKDIQAFQDEAASDAKASEESLQQILDRITEARRNLAANSKASAEQRKLQVAANEAFKKDQVRQREQAARQARSAPRPVTPSTADAIDRNKNRPSRYNEPLIDSIDAARWSVIQSVFPRW